MKDTIIKEKYIQAALYLQKLLEAKKWKNGQLVTIDGIVYRVTKLYKSHEYKTAEGYCGCIGLNPKTHKIIKCDRNCSLDTYASKDFIARVLTCHLNVPANSCLKCIQHEEKS